MTYHDSLLAAFWMGAVLLFGRPSGGIVRRTVASYRCTCSLIGLPLWFGASPHWDVLGCILGLGDRMPFCRQIASRLQHAVFYGSVSVARLRHRGTQYAGHLLVSYGVGLSLRSARTVLENSILTTVSIVVFTEVLTGHGVPFTSEVVQ